MRDTGRGIEREIQPKIATGNSVGVGLRGMRERIRRLGGNLEIESNENVTLVAATLPVVHPKTSSG